MNKMEKFGRILGVVSIAMVILGVLWIVVGAGTSDLEQYTHEYHSFGELVRNAAFGLGLCVLGGYLGKVSVALVELSHKKFRKVWVLNTASNKTKMELVEDGNNIILSEDEVIYKVGEEVCCFR